MIHIDIVCVEKIKSPTISRERDKKEKGRGVYLGFYEIIFCFLEEKWGRIVI